MACREYEDELRELAAGGLAPVREAHVRAHVVGCAACRKAFEAETRLLAAVDAALREEINAEVPASLAARIRIAAAEEPERLQAAWWRWPVVAGTAVAAVVLMMVLQMWERRVTRQGPVTGVPTVERQSPPELARAERTIPNRGRRAVIVRATGRGAAAAARRQPNVLVPAEEQAAFARFAESLQAPGSSARGLLRVNAGDEARLLPIAPMELARLDVKPLEAVRNEQ